jgi:hypothetical protein
MAVGKLKKVETYEVECSVCGIKRTLKVSLNDMHGGGAGKFVSEGIYRIHFLKNNPGWMEAAPPGVFANDVNSMLFCSDQCYEKMYGQSSINLFRDHTTITQMTADSINIEVEED